MKGLICILIATLVHGASAQDSSSSSTSTSSSSSSSSGSSSSSTTNSSVTIQDYTSTAMQTLTNGVINAFVLPGSMSASIFTQVESVVYPTVQVIFNNFGQSSINVPDQSAPFTQEQAFDMQENVMNNLLTGAKVTPIKPIQYYIGLVIRGYLYPIVSYTQAQSNPIITAKQSVINGNDPLNTSLTSMCSGTDWPNRFSITEFQDLCGTDSENPTPTTLAQTAYDALKMYSDDFKILRVLSYYAPIVSNCSTSIQAMPTNPPSSSSSDPTGGTTSTSSSSSIPYYQCYWEPVSSTSAPTSANGWNWEVVNFEYSDIQSLTSTNPEINEPLSNLIDQAKSLANAINTSGLYAYTYYPNYDNGVKAAIGSTVSSMVSDNTTALQKIFSAFTKEVTNYAVSTLNAGPPIFSVTPSIDSVLYTPMYGTNSGGCDPTKGPDTSFSLDPTLDDSNNYAKSFIQSLISGNGLQSTQSQYVSLEPLSSSNPTTVTSIFLHGGPAIYCSSNFSSTDAYKNLCVDASDTSNVYAQSLVSERTGQASQISAYYESSHVLMNIFQSGINSGISNLTALYNKRAYIGNKTGCTLKQLEEYTANWRFSEKTYTSDSSGEAQTWVEHNNSLTDTVSLQRSTNLLLADLLRAVQAQTDLIERQVAGDSVNTVYSHSQMMQQLASAVSNIENTVQQYNSAHKSTNTASSSSSGSS